MESNFLTLKELAAALGRSEHSIRFHLRMGRIRPSVRLGRRYLFKLDEVIKQLQKFI